jgi:hypothetical protein
MPRESPLGSVVPGTVLNDSEAINPGDKSKWTTCAGPSSGLPDVPCRSKEDTDNDGAHTMSGSAKMSSQNYETGPSKNTPYQPLQYPRFYNSSTPIGEDKGIDDDDFQNIQHIPRPLPKGKRVVWKSTGHNQLRPLETASSALKDLMDSRFEPRVTRHGRLHSTATGDAIPSDKVQPGLRSFKKPKQCVKAVPIPKWQ